MIDFDLGLLGAEGIENRPLRSGYHPTFTRNSNNTAYAHLRTYRSGIILNCTALEQPAEQRTE